MSLDVSLIAEQAAMLLRLVSARDALLPDDSANAASEVAIRNEIAVDALESVIVLTLRDMHATTAGYRVSVASMQADQEREGKRGRRRRVPA